MRSSNNVRPLAVVIVLSLTLAFVLGFIPPGGSRSQAAPGWEQQTSGTTGVLLGVSAVDANTAWAVGASGTVLKTTNAGATWTPQQVGTTATFKYVKAVNRNVVWVIDGGDGGPVYKTTDGGNTWSKAFTPSSNESCDGIAVVNTDTAYLLARSHWTSGFLIFGAARILKTTSGGATWATQFSSGAINNFRSLFTCSITAVDSNTAWASFDRYIYKTTDGAAWTQQSTWMEAAPLLSASDANNLWGATSSTTIDYGTIGAVVYRTNNGGTSWTSVGKKPQVYLNCIEASSATVVTAVGYDASSGLYSVIYRTIDGGASWSQQTWATTNTLKGVSAADANTLWAVGDFGTILHTTDGGGQPVTLPPKVSAINPSSGVNTTTYAVEVLGSGFQEGAAVRLEQGTTVINGAGVAFCNSGRLTCYLDLNTKPLGKYDVVVKNPDGQEGRIARGFSVTNICGQGAGTVAVGFGLMMGLLSLGGSGLRRRRLGRKSRGA